LQQQECNENSKIKALSDAMLEFKDYLRIEKTIKNFEGLHTITLQLPMVSDNNLHGQLITHLREGLK
jgi:hypothetical protein